MADLQMCDTIPCEVVLHPLSVKVCYGIAPCRVILSRLKESDLYTEKHENKLGAISKRCVDDKISQQSKKRESSFVSSDSEESFAESVDEFREKHSPNRKEINHTASRRSYRSTKANKNLSVKHLSKRNRGLRDSETSESSSSDSESLKGSDSSYMEDESSRKVVQGRVPVISESSSSESESLKGSDSSYKVDESNRKVKKRKVVRKRVLVKDEISEYEKMIQLNKQRSLAFLETLKIDEVKESLRDGMLKLKARTKQQKKPLPPPRKISSRLAKMDVDLSEDALIRRSLVEARRKLDNVGTQEELPKVLKFEDALKGEEMFSNFIKDFSGLNHRGNERTEFESMKSEIVKLAEFERMKTCKSQIAKVVSGCITALAIHPACDKIIICAASSYGHIGFWNMKSGSNPYVFAPHVEGITNLKFNPYDSNQIISSSYDGGLRCGDMEKLVFDEVYVASSNTSCTYFDVLSKTTFIVAQADGRIAVVDDRSLRKAMVRKYRCHDYPLTCVDVHPLNKNYFISSENKGAIKLWDLRNLRDQPVFDIMHYTRRVQTALFSPVTGNSILSTCPRDSLCIFDSSNLNQSIPLKQSIMFRNCHEGDYISRFKPAWVPNVDNMFIGGSMDHPKKIKVFDDKGKNIFNFMSEDLSSITFCHAFHPSLPVLAAANSTGKVFAFTDVV